MTFVSIFDDLQESLLEFAHAALRVTDASHYVEILCLDLRDSLFDQLDFVVFMRP